MLTKEQLANLSTEQINDIKECLSFIYDANNKITEHFNKIKDIDGDATATIKDRCQLQVNQCGLNTMFTDAGRNYDFDGLSIHHPIYSSHSLYAFLEIAYNPEYLSQYNICSYFAEKEEKITTTKELTDAFKNLYYLYLGEMLCCKNLSDIESVFYRDDNGRISRSQKDVESSIKEDLKEINDHLGSQNINQELSDNQITELKRDLENAK